MARTDYSHGGKEQLEQRISQRLDRIEAKRTTLSDGLPPESKPKSFWLTESYKRLLDTLQLLVIFAGFALTLMSLWRLEESTDLAAWNSVSAEWLKVDQYFVQHSDLRKYVYDGMPIPADQKTRDEVEAAANYVLNLVDYAIGTSDHIVQKYPRAKIFINPGAWKAYVGMTYFRSPAVCDLLGRLREGYAQGTKELAAKTCTGPAWQPTHRN